MTISEIGVITSIVFAVAGVTSSGAKYYADNEYVTNSVLLESEIRNLKREVRKLERVDIEKLSPEEVWHLRDLQDEIEQLEDKRKKD